MTYEYSGYLSTILYKPDPASSESVDAISFTPQDLANWKTLDFNHAPEWRQVPVKRKNTDDCVSIEGDFRGVLAIDSLSADDPRFWAPLSTIDLQDDRFPIDTTQYPIVEVTYRCTSPNAHPTWMWTYEGGSHFGALPKSTEWHTVARNMQHFGFPNRIDDFVLRLYSPTRSIESFEIALVRFRAMSKEESEAASKSYANLEERRHVTRHPLLDEFMPLGVYMDAESAKRLAKMLGISTEDYWTLALEDLTTRHHNAIALSNFGRMTHEERTVLLEKCTEQDIKILVRHDFPLGGPEQEQQDLLEKEIKPYVDSPAIFGHSFSGEPIENDFRDVLHAKDLMEAADPNHPTALIARYPNAYPLFAPFFPASGVGHFASRRPWDVGAMVRAHVPLSEGQQFWVAAPTFMYPTRTPEWSTCPEMRLMVNLAFASGARGWFSYSYHNDPAWLRGRLQRTLTGPFLTFSDLWLELMQRMKSASALAPLFLQARREDAMDDWFVNGVTTDVTAEPDPGIPPISHFHLRGPDYSLYITVSNSVRDMASVEINVPADAVANEEIYDLSEYVSTRIWEPMARQRHVEMFPGQAHIMLVAGPSQCEHWREIITHRLIQDDLRKLKFNLALATTYGLNTRNVEQLIAQASKGSTPDDIATMHSAKDQLIDLIYGSSAISAARSKILEASAAVCGCDGALCRLMGFGKKDLAMAMGESVIRLAREFTAMRLELRQGNGAKILNHSEELAQRSLKLLEEIRSEY